MKPKNILFILLSVLLGLGILMLIFPKDGIKISENFTLQFMTWDEFLKPVKNKDITDILSGNTIDEDTVKFVEVDLYDSMYIDSVLVLYKPVLISVDSTLQRIEFPKNADTILDPLFKTLSSLQTSGELIHILHYGDSQIEVDRMTDYFRMKLQATFGGYGAGFHSGLQTYDFALPIVVSYSDNWFKYTVFPHKDSLITHRRFGISTSYSTFKSIIDSTEEEINAWIKFDKSPSAYSNVKKYNQVKLFYGQNSTNVAVKLYDGENLLFSDILPANESLQIKTWQFESTPSSLKIEYTGTSSPEIYGYSFESYTGVMVDNISVRGSGGTFFGSMDLSLMGQMFAAMNVRLILLQFGGNAIGRDSSNIVKYAGYLGSQMKYLKNIAPNAQIIVIGPADMSEKMKNSYVTRELLPFLIDEMKKVTFENNCAFWNMYEAMGGQNSMPSWVFHDPPLAEKDFIHFTPQGAKIVAQMFYKALIVEYNEYLKQQSLVQ
ncbi:MAG: hypothetical protein JXL97_12940 [Bacteroidales bacterium]|nr:hypothetical protein [Bacteroidales bacterium]